MTVRSYSAVTLLDGTNVAAGRLVLDTDTGIVRYIPDGATDGKDVTDLLPSDVKDEFTVIGGQLNNILNNNGIIPNEGQPVLVDANTQPQTVSLATPTLDSGAIAPMISAVPAQPTVSWPLIIAAAVALWWLNRKD